MALALGPIALASKVQTFALRAALTFFIITVKLMQDSKLMIAIIIQLMKKT